MGFEANKDKEKKERRRTACFVCDGQKEKREKLEAENEKRRGPLS